ncbi:MAG: hypothetical protein AAF573_22220 [Bacteroidota bacterium]
MSTFQESELTFSFPDDWWIKKYDTTKFFTYLSGHGLKGVDFMMISPREELILVEVKNYHDRWADDKNEIASTFENDLQSLALRIIQKFEDTFRLLQIVHQYYQRKMWYRWLLLPLHKRYPTLFSQKTDWVFWLKANELYTTKKVKLYLVLKVPQGVEDTAKVQKKMQTIFTKHLPTFPVEIILPNKNNKVITF